MEGDGSKHENKDSDQPRGKEETWKISEREY